MLQFPRSPATLTSFLGRYLFLIPVLEEGGVRHADIVVVVVSQEESTEHYAWP
jgi:hypothetical protein